MTIHMYYLSRNESNLAHIKAELAKAAPSQRCLAYNNALAEAELLLYNAFICWGVDLGDQLGASHPRDPDALPSSELAHLL